MGNLSRNNTECFNLAINDSVTYYLPTWFFEWDMEITMSSQNNWSTSNFWNDVADGGNETDEEELLPEIN